MNTSVCGGSAKLYAFPAKVRTTVDRHREVAKPATDLGAPRVSEGTFGSGWYHEAAIRESERARKP